ncbi:16S rRNA (uracil(1498)-N(3))-methyltransferase [Gilvimarinus xylanilyticus]|uniref:Ribosomal RNA small subunit methyltransferase E n=1 Tax=Gilvimarinus xylanilyticus TaxID=2944139 RepID=A0A9X2KTH0_9GAMM|nr:16S rRNA (uracil(1498)-N(3))-methyltransferase [Gilvimarinus xylanilyticus]MCP8899921.1 16S rRNA (uracil(1498)-N(3))-methyltransferase [Gilvimarinus xylanilyticus]
MRIPRLYLEHTLEARQTLTLTDRQAHYVARVLRMGSGRPLTVFNGEGGEFSARILDADKKNVTLEIGDHLAENRQSPLEIELAIGLSRGERWDWVLQKATELGVTRLVPLVTERTEVKLKGERLEKKQAHWQQICISACEQCQRNILPQLDSVCTLQDYLPQARGAEKYVLHHRDSRRLDSGAAPASVSLLIGPEGGLSDTEIEAARQAGFSPLTLGPRVLRTETAPIVALSLVQHLWGDL